MAPLPKIRWMLEFARWEDPQHHPLGLGHSVRTGNDWSWITLVGVQSLRWNLHLHPSPCNCPSPYRPLPPRPIHQLWLCFPRYLCALHQQIALLSHEGPLMTYVKGKICPIASSLHGLCGTRALVQDHLTCGRGRADALQLFLPLLFGLLHIVEFL